MMKKVLVPLWALVGIALVMLGVLLYGEIRTSFVYSSLLRMISKEVAVHEPEDIRNFAKWPVERQVGSATLILRTDWKLEDGIYKCIIAEVIKRAGNGDGPYRVGEEYPID